MALPTGIATFQLTFGAAAVLGADEPLGMRITVAAATNAIWTATGQPFLIKKQTATAAVGQSGSIVLISPDQAGFADSNGNPVRNWTYAVHLDYLDGQNNTVTSADKNFAYTTSMGATVDLDLTVPVSTSAGVVVNVPTGNGFTLPSGGVDGQVLGLVNGTLGWITITGGTSSGGGTTTPGTVTGTNNGDGTATYTGAGVTDNGDGTATVNTTSATDNGDGTYTLIA